MKKCGMIGITVNYMVCLISEKLAMVRKNPSAGRAASQDLVWVLNVFLYFIVFSIVLLDE